MKLLERVEWLSRIVFLVFILASAAFLSAITAMRVAIHGREVSMPNLVGKNVGEASQALRSKGLILQSGGPGVQRFADQRGSEADAVSGNADEGVATGTCGAEPGAAGVGDSTAGGKYAARVEN